MIKKKGLLTIPWLKLSIHKQGNQKQSTYEKSSTILSLFLSKIALIMILSPIVRQTKNQIHPVFKRGVFIAHFKQFFYVVCQFQLIFFRFNLKFVVCQNQLAPSFST